MAETEDHLLLRRQPSLRALNGGAQLHGEQLPLRIRTLVDRLQHDLAVIFFVAREQTHETSPTQRIAAAVDGDARQPRLQLRASFESSEMRVGLDERVLRD